MKELVTTKDVVLSTSINCKLCQKAEATKTGSHIFPHFLVRSAINLDGSTARDKEIVFKMGSASFSEAYVGRRINEEEIINAFGDSIDKINLSEQNPFARDNIFCINCEKRITTIETYFYENIFKKYEEGKFKLTLDRQIKYFNSSNFSTELIRLFIFSLIWRASIVKYYKFHLEIKRENFLREVLYDNLTFDIESTIKNSELNSERIKKLPMSSAFFEVDPNHLTENMVFIHPYLNSPYLFIINSFSFCIFFKKKQTHIINEMLKHINYNICDKSLINFQAKEFVFGYQNNYERKLFIQSLIKLGVKGRVETYRDNFKNLHLKIFGFNPDENLTEAFVSNFVYDDSYKGVKHSIEHFADFSLRFFKHLAERK